MQDDNMDDVSKFDCAQTLSAVSKTDLSFSVEVIEKSTKNDGSVKPTVRIVEQPASKELRFRYKSEGDRAGSLPGANSSKEKRTYPTIAIEGYSGEAVVIVSCVTKDRTGGGYRLVYLRFTGCKLDNR